MYRPPEASDNESAQQTVHIVDDDAEIQQLFVQIAKRHDFRVASYTSAEAFLAAFDPEQPGCLVLDLNLPEKSGLDVLHALADLGCEIPVVFMSGMARVSEAVNALKLGSLDFIEKPLPLAGMVSAIEKALDKDRERRLRSQTTEEIRARFSTLTRRELEVMRLVVAGLPNKLIASRLGISPKTIEVHRAHVMQKTRAESLAELVKLAVASDYTVPLVPVKTSDE